MAGISSGGGRSGNRFGGVVLGEFRAEVGSPWNGSGEFINKTDVAIDSLRRGARPKRISRLKESENSGYDKFGAGLSGPGDAGSSPLKLGRHRSRDN